MVNVSNCYYYGTGVERNYQKSFEYCKRSADFCDVNGINSVGAYYINPELKKILDDEKFKFSWINYNEFKDIREKGKGGFATVYSANWFDRINNRWKYVALKVIRNSNENEQEFIEELKNYCEIGYENPSFLECDGVSRNDDGDYIIVMGIAPKGSL
ncbi:hypothetical protein C2G38_2056592 [Gigaspora rosea]|uniref:Protein kinase domain-containing protein n=1 Tax=Gigaspora rosea TaxID=44941 RepID=A0A397W7D2_9GLOM|nr:hypothetical protein C2G38_2056592 [Gigaspora rosea]